MARLSGKTALITAAAQGIGRATAEAFAAEGAQVFATDINADVLGELAPQNGIENSVLDATNGAAIKELSDKIGRVDVLVNCAGVVHHGSILDCTDDEMDFAVDVNIKAAYRMIKQFIPDMLDYGSGSIINIASVCSSIKGLPNRFVYGTTKAALIGLTKAVAADYITSGVRCNAICPGTVESPSLDGRINALPDAVEARKAFIARQPMGRLGKPQEIAAMCVYLASDESQYVSGAQMMVDGGMTI